MQSLRVWLVGWSEDCPYKCMQCARCLVAQLWPPEIRCYLISRHGRPDHTCVLRSKMLLPLSLLRHHLAPALGSSTSGQASPRPPPHRYRCHPWPTHGYPATVDLSCRHPAAIDLDRGLPTVVDLQDRADVLRRGRPRPGCIDPEPRTVSELAPPPHHVKATTPSDLAPTPDVRWAPLDTYCFF
jgi:hypothetical protein